MKVPSSFLGELSDSWIEPETLLATEKARDFKKESLGGPCLLLKDFWGLAKGLLILEEFKAEC